MKRCAQATRPAQWGVQRWIVGAWFDEHEHAQKICEVLGYETDENDREVVRVRFFGQADLFKPEEALLSPHLLFPYQPPAARPVPKRKPHAKKRGRSKKKEKNP
jgi:hypothetical protein